MLLHRVQISIDRGRLRFLSAGMKTGSAGDGYTLSMRLILDPAEEAAHGDWLRRTPGAYEWWYFDALSHDGQYALTCIWFLGNPFSPYYRLAAHSQAADPISHNALFFALYRKGRLYAYHFTRFPADEVAAGESLPLDLKIGPNRLAMARAGCWTLSVRDENANGRRLDAALTFTAPPVIPAEAASAAIDTSHSWLPSAPHCRVSGRMILREPHNPGAEEIAFAGTGYHDHNWGRLPFAAEIRDWHWARAALEGERAAILYHVRRHRKERPVSHFLLFEQGQLTWHDPKPKVHLSRLRINGFGMVYATRLAVQSGAFKAHFEMGMRLDSAPFYVRTLCTATLVHEGRAETGQGIGEYLRPQTMSGALTASAMKARIVER